MDLFSPIRLRQNFSTNIISFSERMALVKRSAGKNVLTTVDNQLEGPVNASRRSFKQHVADQLINRASCSVERFQRIMEDTP